MPTAKEYRDADYARELEKEGFSAVVDGEIVTMFFGPEEHNVSEFDRSATISQKLYHLGGALEQKTPGAIVKVNGERWLVLNHWSMNAAPGWCLSLERNIG